jgi:hypothetical protein
MAYIRNHILNFLHNTRGGDALMPMGSHAAIRTASFIIDVAERLGLLASSVAAPSQETFDHMTNLVQMQLKTTDMTMGFSKRHKEHDEAQCHKPGRFDA